MLLSLKDFQEYVDEVGRLEPKSILALDFETTGVKYQKGARAFLLGFSCLKLGQASYWIEGDNPDHYQNSLIRRLVSHPQFRYAAHNAKFEMHFLRHQFKAEIQGEVWDTMVFERVVKNNHQRYGLQFCAERHGWTKYLPMLEWLKVRKNKGHYDQAPRDLIVPYVEQDAYLSLLLAQEQLKIFNQWQQSSCPIKAVVDLETRTTRNLFEMEERGLRVDLDYCQKAKTYEKDRQARTALAFRERAGCDLVDSRKCLAPVFDARKIPYGRTEKGNPSFTSEHLEISRNDGIVRALLDHRDAVKRSSAYWENFLELAVDDQIHADIRQAGADTFRMSIANPSCQNWPDDEKSDNPYPIRRAFIARPGCLIVSMDYAAMEFRLICDEAGDHATIAAIQDGLDVHQQVAEMAGVARSLAKNGRFAKLYGAGIPKIAATLGISQDLARKISDAIDDASPEVTAYTRRLIRYVQKAPYGFNFLGRRYFFDRGFEYKFPNYRIQGGCAEILRIALDRVETFLRRRASPRTFLILPIHDELVFNWAPEDFHLIPAVKQLMIEAYFAKKSLSMDVNVAIGLNFHDLIEWKEGMEWANNPRLNLKNASSETSPVSPTVKPEKLRSVDAKESWTSSFASSDASLKLS